MSIKIHLLFIAFLLLNCEHKKHNELQKPLNNLFDHSELIRKVFISKAAEKPETICFYEKGSVFIKSHVLNRGYTEHLYSWKIVDDGIAIYRQDGAIYSIFKFIGRTSNSYIVSRGYSNDGEMFWQPDTLFFEK